LTTKLTRNFGMNVLVNNLFISEGKPTNVSMAKPARALTPCKKILRYAW